eukprot:CAMPEP_0169453814 /NCGR_PEP_ID=MMETSP1042-20121227/14951_1 /TAXON_ID=464988 /ORGANISM="Hemiselmis andersenii, Strain CCMP1180" /LENGTH=154 /DNA_ID=CAMNT_0009565857 /DNA_START=103 /DNA_END=567 /DNA_ORIENTATION=-
MPPATPPTQRFSVVEKQASAELALSVAQIILLIRVVSLPLPPQFRLVHGLRRLLLLHPAAPPLLVPLGSSRAGGPGCRHIVLGLVRGRGRSDGRQGEDAVAVLDLVGPHLVAPLLGDALEIPLPAPENVACVGRLLQVLPLKVENLLLQLDQAV